MRTTHRFLGPCLVLLVAPLLLPVACAQDDGAGEVGDESPFLDLDKASCEDPPLKITRPSDSWQFVDLEKVKAQRQAQGESLQSYATLKFQLWYGAARASILVRAFSLGGAGKLPELEELVDGGVRELQGILRDAEVKAKKGVKVGKRPAAWYQVEGQAPEPRRPTELRPVVVIRVVAVRPEDRTVLLVQLEHGDPKRTEDLSKDHKDLLKKAKF